MKRKLDKLAGQFIRGMIFRSTVGGLVMAVMAWWLKHASAMMMVLIVLLFETPALVICGLVLSGAISLTEKKEPGNEPNE